MKRRHKRWIAETLIFVTIISMLMASAVAIIGYNKMKVAISVAVSKDAE